jgi:hypothetical protein
MRRFAPALFSLLAACAALPQAEEDRLHCQALMYADRAGRRSPPNWNLYEYCMRSRAMLPG